MNAETKTKLIPVTANEHYEIQKFLFNEARLLDEERYEEWLNILSEDIHYWMPNIELLYRKDNPSGYNSSDIAHFDDDLETLKLRIRRFSTGLAWPEDPPTRHSIMISNIEAFRTHNPSEFSVSSSFILYRSKLANDVSTLHGRREDTIQEINGDLKLTKRKIILSHSLLHCKNLNVFV